MNLFKVITIALQEIFYLILEALNCLREVGVSGICGRRMQHDHHGSDGVRESGSLEIFNLGVIYTPMKSKFSIA